MADNSVVTIMKGLKLALLIFGWIISFLGTIFVMTLMGADWNDFEDTWWPPFMVIIFGWVWPLILLLALVVAIAAFPVYGVFRLAKYIRNRHKRISSKEAG